jgi:Flp pilus assembly protein TadG
VRRLREAVRRLITRFAHNERAVAAVEFALILPFLITLYMGSIEASSLFTVDRRIEVISATTADLLARWNPNEGPIPKATVQDYFRAAEGIITPYATSGLKQVLSFVTVNAAATSIKVAWSCAYNGGTALTTGSDFTLGDKMKLLATSNKTKAGFVIVAKTSYSYRPVLGMVFTSALNLENQSLFLPRFGATLAAPTGGCPTNTAM